MSGESCNINDRGNSCCSPKAQIKEINIKEHWNNTYLNSSGDKLGWYEVDLSPTLSLISKTDLQKTARLLNVGSGSTTLIDELLAIGYSNLIATDISEVALKKLEDRIGVNKVE